LLVVIVYNLHKEPEIFHKGIEEKDMN